MSDYVSMVCTDTSALMAALIGMASLDRVEHRQKPMDEIFVSIKCSEQKDGDDDSQSGLVTNPDDFPSCASQMMAPRGDRPWSKTSQTQRKFSRTQQKPSKALQEEQSIQSSKRRRDGSFSTQDDETNSTSSPFGIVQGAREQVEQLCNEISPECMQPSKLAIANTSSFVDASIIPSLASSSSFPPADQFRLINPCTGPKLRDEQTQEMEFRIQWSIERNQLPGLDRWKGVLRSSNSSPSCHYIASVPLSTSYSSNSIRKDVDDTFGVVQGFWVRKSSKLPLNALSGLHSMLGHFWGMSKARGWPAAQKLHELDAQKENAPNGTLRRKKKDSKSSTGYCCLITHVWISPAFRGDGWGLALTEKASNVVPRRYQDKMKRRRKRRGSSNKDELEDEPSEGPIPVLLALPPTTHPRLRRYLTQGGWQRSDWHQDFYELSLPPQEHRPKPREV